MSLLFYYMFFFFCSRTISVYLQKTKAINTNFSNEKLKRRHIVIPTGYVLELKLWQVYTRVLYELKYILRVTCRNPYARVDRNIKLWLTIRRHQTTYGGCTSWEQH